MKKILFVIGSLQIGGAETVMVDILNNIYNEFDITVLLIEKRGELLDRLTDNVKVRYLTKGDMYCNNAIDKFYNKIKRSLIYRFFGKNKYYIKRIYKNILKEKYDTEIGFLVGLPTEIVRRSPNKESKKVTWIHADVTKDDREAYKKYYDVYKYFDKIIGVSEASIKTFKETFPGSTEKIELIYNFIDTKKIINKSEEKVKDVFSSDTINFLSIGRLVSEKGFDRIINISKKYEGKITFYIIGSGPLEEELKKEIEEKNIENIFLIGLRTNPYPYIKMSDVFLLSSRSEAYPTVVLEAMILQKDIIATTVAGTKEILENYDNKILVSNNDDSIEVGIDKWLKKKDKEKESHKVNNTFEKNNKENLEKIKRLLEE